jgi:hypothetical protein
VITYYRDLDAYGDGKYLYVSASGIMRSWRGVGPAGLSYFARVSGASRDLITEHWGGFAGGELSLYRRDRVRKWFGDPSRSKMRLPKYPSDLLGLPLPGEVAA